MNGFHTGLIAVTLATALFSMSSLAQPRTAGASKDEPSAPKKIAFHVIGLMKTKSGAT